MIRLCTGYDPREAAGWHAFSQSVIETSSEPVAIIPLTGKQHDGTNAFTYARFRVPEIFGFAGFAIFVDACDMLLRGDIASLWAMRNKKYAVQVVKHDYETKHQKKYIGTEMESANSNYPRKNWSSVIIWNCGHLSHFQHREELRGSDGAFLHRFAWLDDEEIGELPAEWNHLTDEQGPSKEAKLLHWTCGQVGFRHYRSATHADEWLHAHKRTQLGFE